ncbi:MAG: hypothetical protein ACTSV2_19890 [Candidatus Thorarchaeota archaeon]
MSRKVSKNYGMHREQVETTFEGTIIDIETVGEFRRVGGFSPLGQDYLGRYKDMKITTVGFLSENELSVFFVKDAESLDNFRKKAISILKTRTAPTYAFNKSFEEGCYFWNSGQEILHIDNELQRFTGEKKENVVIKLGINKYDDPFHGEGRKCVSAFFQGNIDDIVKHNRACLLKENQILAKRGAKKIKTIWHDSGDTH